MSRKPSKFRKRKREQREHRTVDFETATLIGRELRLGARRGNFFVVINGGDFIHEPVLHGDLVPYEIGDRVKKTMADFNKVINRSVFGEDDNG